MMMKYDEQEISRNSMKLCTDPLPLAADHTNVVRPSGRGSSRSGGWPRGAGSPCCAMHVETPSDFTACDTGPSG